MVTLILVMSACGGAWWFSKAQLAVLDGVDAYEQGAYTEAISYYDKAIELDPGLAEAYYFRGLAYGDLDEHQRAIENYTKAIQIDPPWPTTAGVPLTTT
jgi:tetratricopeptide (TPR) repeat protein